MDLPDIAADPAVQDLVRRALEEDVGPGDATTVSLVDDARQIEAAILAREDCVVSGTDVAGAVFTAVSPDVTCEVLIRDSGRAAPDARILLVRGPARAILTGERTALNFMQRMTGIATLTRRFVDRVAAHGTTVLDTRKTTPTLRKLEKYAVLCGGGQNHRMGLYDRVMIKDNHRRLCKGRQTLGLEEAVRAARQRYPDLAVEVEVETEAELAHALRARPDWVLFDNLPPARLKPFVEACGEGVRTEASGGLTLDTVEAVAATGVDAVSLGCLTHSAPSTDLSLEICA